MRSLGLIALLVVLLGSVLGLMGRSHVPNVRVTRAEIPSSAYDRLTPGVTTRAELSRMGFDMRNAERISELGLIEHFVRGDSVDFDALDQGVKDCLLGRARCDAYLFPLTDMPGTEAVVVAMKDKVVYKTLTGKILTAVANPSWRY
jgi:hypothetical protein